MSYIVEQKRGSIIYLYEVQSYWDPKTKKTKQKRKYLGKKDPITGQPIRVRQKQDITPRNSKDYGHVYLLKQFADKIGLSDTLKAAFPNDFNDILNLVYFEISEA